MLGVGIGKYQIKPLSIIVACLLTGQMVCAEDDSVKKKDENINGQEAINLSQVVVQVESQSIIGMDQGLGASEVGKSTLNQTQLDIIQGSNMASVLDKMPGVTMGGSPRPGGQVLNIWGMSDTQSVPIMVDGALKTFGKYRQGTLFVDPDLIKNVTVNKGAFSPEIGNGGFGGNVQLTTKDAKDFLKDNQNLGAFIKYGHHSNNDQNNYTAAIYGQTKNQVVDGLIYYTNSQSNDVRLADHEKYRGSSMDQYSYLAKSNIYLGEEAKLTLSASNTQYKGWMPFAAMGGNTIIVDPDNDYDWKRRIFYRDQRDKNYSANFEYVPSDNPLINFKADVAYSETKQHDQKIAPMAGQKPPSVSLSTFGKENWTTYKNTNIHLRNSSIFNTGEVQHKVTVGLQYLRKQQTATMFYDSGKYGSPEFNNGYFTPPYLPAGRQTIMSAYIADEIKLGDFTITPSLRYDHVKNQSFGNIAGYASKDPKDGHDYRPVKYEGFSPRLSVYWQPNDTWALFTDYSHSWQSPNIHDQYTVQAAGTSGPNGTSRDLGKEKLRALRFGGMLNLQNVIVSEDRLTFQATAFQNKVKNEVIRKIGAIYCEEHHVTGNNKVCGKPMSAYHNGPGYTIKGLELDLKYDSEYIFGGLAATIIKGKRIGSPRNIWQENGTWMRDIPPRELTATIGFNIPQYNFSMGWQSKMVRKQTRSPVTLDPKAGALSYPLTPGYSVHNIFMVYQPYGDKGPKVNLTVDNLFNKNYSPYLSEKVPAPGRDIRLSVSYQF